MAASSVEQVAVEVLGPRSKESQVEQVAVEILGPRAKDSSVEQVAVEVLCIRNDCPPTPCPAPAIENLETSRGHRLTSLWEMERDDGTTYYLTDHNEDLDFDGNTYSAAGSMSAKAREFGANEINTEGFGAILASAFTVNDVDAGLWDDAKITERVVDWRYPWLGCITKHVWYMRELRQDGEEWRASLGGISTRQQRRYGNVLSRTCWNDLGDAFGQAAVPGCKYDVASNTETGTVSTIVAARREFTATGITGSLGDSYFAFGDLTWTSGANNGLTFQVREDTEDTTASTYQLQLQLRTPFAIAAGDTFSVTPGDDKTLSTCKTKFSQLDNFRGFPYMPGKDGLAVNPNE